MALVLLKAKIYNHIKDIPEIDIDPFDCTLTHFERRHDDPPLL